MKRLTLCATAASLGAALALAGLPAVAQQFPTKPIRFLVGFAPGGSVDILARDLGGQMTVALGQQVVIDNRSGAAGLIAADLTAKAPPDGHTLLMAIPNHVIAPSVYAKIPYDTINDFAPVSLVASSPFMVLANLGVPANTLKEFIALVKSKPGQLNFATPGVGSIQHLSNELMNTMAGIKMVHVPYKGGVPALIDTIAGAAAITFITTVQGLPNVKAGKVKVYGVTSARRAAVLPDVPTVSEAGVPGFESVVWFGVLTSVKTPKPIVDKLNREIKRIIATPEMRDRVVQQGGETLSGSAEDLGKYMRDDLKKWAAAAKQAGIKPE
ncbi:MAG TPA: tripartite tricarboxylate transporter substrate binding protein [Burkholderiales bacterium]|nr:tripartite tricarboxylate transporter substrate binding protein [Burkholderiales bacterium]